MAAFKLSKEFPTPRPWILPKTVVNRCVEFALAVHPPLWLIRRCGWLPVPCRWTTRRWPWRRWRLCTPLSRCVECWGRDTTKPPHAPLTKRSPPYNRKSHQLVRPGSAVIHPVVSRQSYSWRGQEARWQQRMTTVRSDRSTKDVFLFPSTPPLLSF